MEVTRKELIDALCDLLDGEHNPYDIQTATGFGIKRCKEILKIRDAVKDEWLKE